MGNQNEKAKSEVYLIERKMKQIVTEIRKYLSAKEFEDLPFLDQKKILGHGINKCQQRLELVEKQFPTLVDFKPFHRDFGKMRSFLEKIQYRPDITDKKVLENLIPNPVLEADIPSDEDLFPEDQDVLNSPIGKSKEKVKNVVGKNGDGNVGVKNSKGSSSNDK